jgi:hypothetical protein
MKLNFKANQIALAAADLELEWDDAQVKLKRMKDANWSNINNAIDKV